MKSIPEMPATEANTSVNNPAPETRTHCPLCGAVLDPANPAECPKCDWIVGYRQRQERPASTVKDRIAVVMSVVPGAGHIYKGHVLLGAVLMVGTLIAIFGAVVAATATALWGMLLLPFYWAGVMLHVFWAEDISKPAPRQGVRKLPPAA
ncbi:MAG: hypothetical protein V4710_17080 [Verrucomicrobiota bacterium]